MDDAVHGPMSLGLLVTAFSNPTENEHVIRYALDKGTAPGLFGLMIYREEQS